MRAAGIVLLVLGIIATIVFGIQAANESETASFLGMDIAISKADWTPLIVSVIVLVVGIILMATSKKKSHS